VIFKFNAGVLNAILHTVVQRAAWSLCDS